jgi:hypothetical protein
MFSNLWKESLNIDGHQFPLTRPFSEDNICLWHCPSGENTTTLSEIQPTTYTFPLLSTEIPRGSSRICTGNKGLKMLNLSDQSVSKIINSDISYIYCLATSEDKIYYTSCNSDTVTCCDLQPPCHKCPYPWR